MAEHGDKVDASQKTAIETAIAELKEAVKGDDADDIKAKTNTLAQASMKLGEAMYKAQQAEGAAGEAAADGAGKRPSRRQCRRRRLRGSRRRQERRGLKNQAPRAKDCMGAFFSFRGRI